MNDVTEIIRKIHNAPQQGVLVVSGAGSGAVARLLRVAGASRTLLEVVIPYGEKSMTDFLGFEPEQFVSEETAKHMARAAYRRGLELRENDLPVVGVACTAAIATDRPKRGEHRAYAVTWGETGWSSFNLRLDKGRRDRAGEEDVVSGLVIQALARACGIESKLSLGLMDADAMEARHEDHPDPLTRLISGDVRTVTVDPKGRMRVDEPVTAPLVPGSFNPLHRGHEGLARAAAEMLGPQVVYEMSITNVDKPPLTLAEVKGRLDRFRGKGTVVLTRAETYQKKSVLFPGCTFVIGWDTAVRLVAPRYYGNDEARMLAALAQVWAAGCRFLVAGREEDGKFNTLSTVPIPEGFKPIFQSIPESLFRVDISSSALRSQGQVS